MVGTVTSTTSSLASISSTKSNGSAALEAQLAAKQAELAEAKTDEDKKEINTEISKLKSQISALKATEKQDTSQASKAAAKSGSSVTVGVTSAEKAAPESKVPGAVMDVLMKMRPGGGTSGADDEGERDLSKLYSDMDADDDGKLSKSEFVTASANRMGADDAGKLFDAMDSAKTGSVTEDQFATGMKPPAGGRPPMGPPPEGFDPSSASARHASSGDPNKV